MQRQESSLKSRKDKMTSRTIFAGTPRSVIHASLNEQNFWVMLYVETVFRQNYINQFFDDNLRLQFLLFLRGRICHKKLKKFLSACQSSQAEKDDNVIEIERSRFSKSYLSKTTRRTFCISTSIDNCLRAKNYSMKTYWFFSFIRNSDTAKSAKSGKKHLKLRC